MFKKDFFNVELINSFDLKLKYRDERKAIKATAIIEYYSTNKEKIVKLVSKFQDDFRANTEVDHYNYTRSRAIIDVFNKCTFLLLKINQNYSKFEAYDYVFCDDKEIYLTENFCILDLKFFLRQADYIAVKHFSRIRKHFREIEDFYTFKLKD